MRVDNLIIALQEYPADTEVWLCEDFFGDPKDGVSELVWKDRLIPTWEGGRPIHVKEKVLCIR